MSAAAAAGWYGLLLWFPEFMKRRGAEAVQVYFQMLLVALSNLPGRHPSRSATVILMYSI
jgi:hypothetical protein